MSAARRRCWALGRPASDPPGHAWHACPAADQAAHSCPPLLSPACDLPQVWPLLLPLPPRRERRRRAPSHDGLSGGWAGGWVAGWHVGGDLGTCALLPARTSPASHALARPPAQHPPRACALHPPPQDHLVRDMDAGRFGEACTLLLVTHGLASRIFLMRWVRWAEGGQPGGPLPACSARIGRGLPLLAAADGTPLPPPCSPPLPLPSGSSTGQVRGARCRDARPVAGSAAAHSAGAHAAVASATVPPACRARLPILLAPSSCPSAIHPRHPPARPCSGAVSVGVEPGQRAAAGAGAHPGRAGGAGDALDAHQGAQRAWCSHRVPCVALRGGLAAQHGLPGGGARLAHRPPVCPAGPLPPVQGVAPRAARHQRGECSKLLRCGWGMLAWWRAARRRRSCQRRPARHCKCPPPPPLPPPQPACLCRHPHPRALLPLRCPPLSLQDMCETTWQPRGLHWSHPGEASPEDAPLRRQCSVNFQE